MNEPIQEKAPKPPGLLPKNVQSWLIHRPRRLDGRDHVADRRQKAADGLQTERARAQAPAPLEVNETKITELQNRIQELQRQQLVAQNALAEQSRVLGVRPTGQPTAISRVTTAILQPRSAAKTLSKPSVKSAPTFRCLLQTLL